MADATTAAPTPGPRQRGSWLRFLGWFFAIVAVLLVTFYFVLTSPTFFKVRILPRVSEFIHATITVSGAEIHPFSQIVLRDLKIQPTNQPPVLTAREVRVRYSLFDIISGNIRVDEIALASPVVQWVENADGTSNFDPLLKSQKKPAQQKTPKSGQASKPPEIDIRKLTISNASFLVIQKQSVGTRNLVELTNVSVTLTGVKNGGPGKVEFAAIIRDENNPPAPAMYGLLQAKIDGSFDFALTPELKPGPILGDAHLNISQAAGSFSDFAKLDGRLHCDFSLSEIRSVTLNFEKGGVPLGELRASGPYDAEKSQGRLNVELLSVDKQVLNLFGAKAGLGFGSTTISLTNQIELSKSGAAISAMGQLSASKFQLSLTNESTPPIDLHADYNVSLDKTEKTALLRALNVTGLEKGRPLLRAELTSPMTLAWGNKTNAVGDSSFKFTITKLNIADWKTFAGNLASEGTLDLSLKLLSQQGGRRLTFDATNEIQNLTTDVGGQHLSDTTLAFKTHGEATNLKQFDLSDFSLQLAKSNHAALTISGSGTYDRTSASADLQITLRATIARLLQLVGQTGIAASSGTAQLKARVTQQQQTQTLTGNLAITNFTGKVGQNEFTNFGTMMTLDVQKTPAQIEIRKATGAVTKGRSQGGNFDLSGTYSLTNKPSQFTVKLSDLNENGLRPFVEPLLAGRKLVSVAVAGTASGQREPSGDSAIKADLEITNLVVNDPASELPATPLDAKVELDAALTRQIADVHQLQITLTPTQRAKNQFQLRGRVDDSKTNAIQGNLTLTADSLDLTSYYDLFANTNKPAATPPSRNTSQSVAGNAPPRTQAAATNQLPFKNFTVDANVREFYLREIAATNFQATVRLDRSRIQLKPFQLTLNGSPMRGSADVDLSVPGYKYNVIFNATNVPFAPLWNTFKPAEKGEMNGTLTALVDMSGVGTTGETLQKTLTGKFDIGATNLNLSVDKIRSPVLKAVIFVVARMPELLKNPAGAGNSIAGGALENALGARLTGDLSEDLRKSPIDAITARGTAGAGKVELQQATMRSAAFQADATGTISLAPELTNSAIQIPINISLARPIAERIHFVPDNTPSNAAYVKFPDFYSESGTLGRPSPHINPLPLGHEELHKLGFNFPDLQGTNDALGNMLQGFGGMSQGGSATNQPATNQPPVNDFLNRLLAPGN